MENSEKIRFSNHITEEYLAKREAIRNENRKEIEKILSQRPQNIRRFQRNSSLLSSQTLSERIRNRKAELDNAVIEENMRLKRLTLSLLFILLGLETIAIFTIAFFQGFKFKAFSLDEWSFNLIVFATITQITTMLMHAVIHLFPKISNK